MIIAFRGMTEKENKSFSNMIASAFAVTLQHNVKVILMDSSFGSCQIEDAFSRKAAVTVQEPFAYMGGGGMDYLLKRSQYGMLSSNTVRDGVVYINEQIGYIPGAAKNSRVLYDIEFGQECQNILKHLNTITDYVFVDCGQASKEAGTKILEEADLIVVNIEQSEKILDDYFSHMSPLEHKIVYCIGNYIKEEPCNLKNIQRMYRLKNRSIGVVPYNIEFLTSLHRGKALAFFANHMVRSRYYRNKEFFQEIYRLAEEILQWEENHIGEVP